MTPFRRTDYLHVWFARRPLVASRAAVLASLLPADADRAKFLHVLGIHGDPLAAKVRIAEANRRVCGSGRCLRLQPGVPAQPDPEEREWIKEPGRRGPRRQQSRPCWTRRREAGASRSSRSDSVSTPSPTI